MPLNAPRRVCPCLWACVGARFRRACGPGGGVAQCPRTRSPHPRCVAAGVSADQTGHRRVSAGCRLALITHTRRFVALRGFSARQTETGVLRKRPLGRNGPPPPTSACISPLVPPSPIKGERLQIERALVAEGVVENSFRANAHPLSAESPSTPFVPFRIHTPEDGPSPPWPQCRCGLTPFVRAIPTRLNSTSECLKHPQFQTIQSGIKVDADWPPSPLIAAPSAERGHKVQPMSTGDRRRGNARKSPSLPRSLPLLASDLAPRAAIVIVSGLQFPQRVLPRGLPQSFVADSVWHIRTGICAGRRQIRGRSRFLRSRRSTTTSATSRVAWRCEIQRTRRFPFTWLGTTLLAASSALVCSPPIQPKAELAGLVPRESFCAQLRPPDFCARPLQRGSATSRHTAPPSSSPQRRRLLAQSAGPLPR